MHFPSRLSLPHLGQYYCFVSCPVGQNALWERLDLHFERKTNKQTNRRAEPLIYAGEFPKQKNSRLLSDMIKGQGRSEAGGQPLEVTFEGCCAAAEGCNVFLPHPLLRSPLWKHTFRVNDSLD